MVLLINRYTHDQNVNKLAVSQTDTNKLEHIFVFVRFYKMPIKACTFGFTF